jgi:hypothetical protein
MAQLRWVLVILALAGCTSERIVWNTPETDQFRRDNYECTRDSTTYGGGSGLAGAVAMMSAQRQANALYKQCMESKGYRESKK